MEIQSKTDAQGRADRIGAFQAELAALLQEKIVTLSDDQHSVIAGYHERLLAGLSTSYDIDVDKRDAQLSLGMKIASFLGALGLAASVFFLFYQFWGRIPTSVQVALLVVAPGLGLLATGYVACREKTGYFAKLLGMVCLSCFVLNLVMLGQIFNINPSPNAFLIWAVFALILAYAADARLLLAAGIMSLAAFISARAGTWAGCYWLHFGERPENFFPAAAILFSASFFSPRRFSGFAVIYRVFALLLLFLPILVLANWGRGSYLHLTHDSIEAIYVLAGFLLSGLAIWLGILRGWPEVVNTGNVFFVIFLYTKFYQWWWEWMPKYLFFLVIGLTAILMLFVFKRLRSRVVGDPAKEGKA
jgi:uncharacterized membrane protein